MEQDVSGFGEIVIAVLAGIGAFFAYLARRHGANINDAVNHRHLKKNGEGDTEPPKLYDLAWENHQKTDALVQWKNDHEKVHVKLDQCIEKLTALEEQCLSSKEEKDA